MAQKSILAVFLAVGALVAGTVFAQDQQSGGMAPHTTGYVPVEGGEVFYQIHGEGDPLVVLHGGLGAFEMFSSILPQLVAGRQIIGVDLDGHGRTLPLDRPASYETLGDDVAAVLDALEIETADVMGYSHGAAAALWTALGHSDRVGSLTMLSAPLVRSAWHDYNLEGMDQMGAHLAEAMMPTPMYELYAQIAPDPDNWPVLLDRMGDYTQGDYDWSARFAELEMPVLIAAGDWDSVRTAHLAEMFALLGGGQTDGLWDGSGMTNVRLAIVPGETHYSVFASPVFAQMLADFLDGH